MLYRAIVLLLISALCLMVLPLLHSQTEKFYHCKRARGNYVKEGSTCRCVLCQSCHDKLRQSVSKLPPGKKSRRATRQEMVDLPQTVHLVDDNGCSHTNPETFQHSDDRKYYSPTPLFSQFCLLCGVDIPKKIWGLEICG